MPYISPTDRKKLDNEIELLKLKLLYQFGEDDIEGALKYTITSLLDIMPRACNWRYKYINRVIGVLESVKLEFYRRLVSTYEDKAMEKHKDLPIYEKFK